MPKIPGEVLFGDGEVLLLGDRPVTILEVVNGGDRPVQVGSHFHFAEVNHALRFDRAAAAGGYERLRWTWPAEADPAATAIFREHFFGQEIVRRLVMPDGAR